MSTLKSIYEREGSDALDRLCRITGINRKYLYQLATGRRKPSAQLAFQLLRADPRLTLEGLLLGEALSEAGEEPPQAPG